jgi:hypothetical protein
MEYCFAEGPGAIERPHLIHFGHLVRFYKGCYVDLTERPK